MTVRETTCKSALIKSDIADYALNPYTGCTHNCVYCYASFMARFSRHEQPWGQWVDAKINVADVLQRDVLRLLRQQQKPGAGPVEVIISSVTDAYQPLERSYRLTRACLETIAASVTPASTRARINVSILTKSDLVVRDLDVLQGIPDLKVGMTITTDDDVVSRLYEPAAPPVTRRLAALRKLSSAGIDTWAFISPVLPYHSDSEQALRSIMSALADAGVTRVMVDRFNPYPASVGRFLKVAPSEAAQALRGYVATPLGYLDRLKEAVNEAATGLELEVTTLF